MFLPHENLLIELLLGNCVSISLPCISVSNYMYNRVLHQYTDRMLRDNEIGQDRIGAARKSMLLFHTPTVVKVVTIVGLSLITLMCLYTINAKLLTPFWGVGKGTDKIGIGAAIKVCK